MRVCFIVALAVLAGCAMERHRQQVREGFFTRGLHREAFVKEWGRPTRTFTIRGPEPVLRQGAFSGSWERPVYEVWEYADRATCLTFDGVRLVTWETGKTDCTPRPSPERPERRPRSPAGPYPPYP